MNKTRLAIIGLVIIAGVVGGTLIITSISKPSARLGDLPTTLTYAALGDSVAAGDGLTSDLNATCKSSSEAYPTLLQGLLKQKGYSVTLNSLACSGATTNDITGGPTSQSTVGQLPSALASGSTPDLITITIGANDISWLNLITQCASSGCGSAVDSTKLDASLASLKSNLTSIVTSINQSGSKTSTKIVLTGYYSPFDNISCINIGNRISATSIDWLKAQTVKLNDTIKSVATTSPNTIYAPLDFSNHGICDNDPWIQDVSSPAPFHPTVNGQKAIAKQLLSVI